MTVFRAATPSHHARLLGLYFVEYVYPVWLPNTGLFKLFGQDHKIKDFTKIIVLDWLEKLNLSLLKWIFMDVNENASNSTLLLGATVCATHWVLVEAV